MEQIMTSHIIDDLTMNGCEDGFAISLIKLYGK